MTLINNREYMYYQTGLDIKYLVYVPIGHVVLKIYVPCKNFHLPSQYLYKPCKVYVHCWENKYMPRLKNHLPSRARNHKSLCALRQDLHAPGMRARLNVEPCQMHTVHYLNRPLDIDQPTQPSCIGGLLGDQTFPLHRLQKAILVD